MPRHLEDWTVGDRVETGTITLTEEAALRFAREYDPQPFHLDHEAAKHSLFGRLAASGWQTAALSMRLIVESKGLTDDATIGIGVDELRWRKPVYPGDTLRVVAECVGVTPHESKASGIVKIKMTTYNQHAEIVMEHVALIYARRRAA
jgi:acyl dehydratase